MPAWYHVIFTFVPGVSGAHQKALGSGAQTTQYFGPCPGGSTHKYVFTVYALNVATLLAALLCTGVMGSPPPADADILHRLQEQGCPGNDRHLAPEPRDHPVGGYLTFAERIQ